MILSSIELGLKVKGSRKDWDRVKICIVNTYWVSAIRTDEESVQLRDERHRRRI